MKKLALLILILFLINPLSCKKEGVSLLSSTLSLVREVKGREETSRYLIFSFLPSEDLSASLILRSPDGTLEWSSTLSEDEGYYKSEALYLTNGALFEKGEYTYFILKNDGSEITGPVTLNYQDDYLPSAEYDSYGNAIIKLI